MTVQSLHRTSTPHKSNHRAVGAARSREREREWLAARAIVISHGHDSLSRFALRPDKAFHFAQDGMIAYRVIGRTAVASGDPIAADADIQGVTSDFLSAARRRRWNVVLWGAAGQHLPLYRELGLHSVCAGEEAVVDPAAFTLDGRRVRKLRQSVHRVERLGWSVDVRCDMELDIEERAAIAEFERTWRAQQQRLLGFAMSFGAFDDEAAHPHDLYVLGRAPEGRLCAVMRFVAHCGKLSLDTMRRVGDSPNGLNEAMVCHALGTARRDHMREVSLNYAGLGHLVRDRDVNSGVNARLGDLAVKLAGERFQMERLVRFSEKFHPEWRPRYLVYGSRLRLPMAVLRIFQAEGHVSERLVRGRASAISNSR
jgi:lysyl-tRNA synthetase class 2